MGGGKDKVGNGTFTFLSIKEIDNILRIKSEQSLKDELE